MKKIFKGMENGPEAIDSNFNELADPKRDVTVNDLKVNGNISLSNQKVITNQFMMGNMQVTATRILNEVVLYFSGTLPGSDWNTDGDNPIPFGFRPVTPFITDLSDNNGYAKVGFNPDGTMYRRGSNNFGGDVQHAINYPTNDSWPE